MKLYLVRHGDARPASLDPERRLSDAGHEQARRLAAFFSARGVGVDRVLHSGKPRALETAAVLVADLAAGRDGTAASSLSPVARAGLDPNDPVEPLAEEIAAWQDDCLIVGHLPHLSRLATLLLCGRVVASGLDFEPAAAACLRRENGGAWSLAWFVGPSLL